MSGWASRWETLIGQGRIEDLGPKGRDYFAEHYGQIFEPRDTYSSDDFDDLEPDYEAEGEY